jgi:hypothetical protein
MKDQNQSKNTEKQKPEIVIQVFMLSAQKIIQTESPTKIGDIAADVIMRKLIIGDMAVTEQKIGDSYKLLKIDKFGYNKQLQITIGKKEQKIKLSNENLSLVEYKTLFLQFFRLTHNGTYYLIPNKDYTFTEEKIKWKKQTPYIESDILKELKTLTNKYVRPKTITHCKS